MSRPLRVAALIKQVPRFEQFELGPDGRLIRQGLELEMNPYCRRAVAKAVELARASGGTSTVVTLGPPSAEDSLREAIACGVDQGVLVSDPAFAGSDTLATASALAAALRLLGPFDLLLCGRNSVDADTGQTPAELAELLDLPFAGAVRTLDITDDGVQVECELDDGRMTARLPLPALLSCAERLCSPAKAEADQRAVVPAERLRTLTAADLGPGSWGENGSPTAVGRVQRLAVERMRRRLDGDVRQQVQTAVALLEERGAFSRAGAAEVGGELPPPRQERHGNSGPWVAVLIEPGRERTSREILGRAAVLAAALDGIVAAIAPTGLGAGDAGSWGADHIVPLLAGEAEEDVSAALATWCDAVRPWAVLGPGTMWGREVLGRAAARLGAGLVGDAVDLDLHDGRLVAWKPAFGGELVAAITSRTDIQMATVRAGVLPLLAPRVHRAARAEAVTVMPRGRDLHGERLRDDDMDILATADAVVTVGSCIPPSAYEGLQPLLDTLGAVLGATRRVTDNGWLPRSRQVGITGRTVSPRLYMALGVGGKFNHVIGARGAGTIVAVNSDPSAPIFDAADIGLVAAWEEVVPLLVEAVRSIRPTGRTIGAV